MSLTDWFHIVVMLKGIIHVEACTECYIYGHAGSDQISEVYTSVVLCDKSVVLVCCVSLLCVIVSVQP